VADTDFLIGGEIIKAPPLSIYALRQEGVWAAITSIGQSSSVLDEMDKYLTILAASLSQTSSPISLDDLRRRARIVDFRGMDDATLRLFRASGMAGEGDEKSGEAPAASPSAEVPESGTTS